MPKETSLSKNFLNAIHRERTSNRDLAYWLGFLEGVISSGTVELEELGPLQAHCEAFLKEFDDDDARDLIEDLKLAWDDIASEAHAMLIDIVEVRMNQLSMIEGRNLLNRFLGFLKGIACDGKLFKTEVEKIIWFVDRYPALLNDKRIENVRRIATNSLYDDVITDDESEELCYWISRLVGDSFADTGLSAPTDVGATELFVISITPKDLVGATVVLTGEFVQLGLSRPQIQVYLEKLGAHCVKNISRKVDYLFVASEASRYWATPNAGTKLMKAHELLSVGDRPSLVSERTLAQIFHSL